MDFQPDSQWHLSDLGAESSEAAVCEQRKAIVIPSMGYSGILAQLHGITSKTMCQMSYYPGFISEERLKFGP